jgi:hypothetical protein
VAGRDRAKGGRVTDGGRCADLVAALEDAMVELAADEECAAERVEAIRLSRKARDGGEETEAPAD